MNLKKERTNYYLDNAGEIDDKSVKQCLKVLILAVGPYDISPPWNEGTKNNQIAWINYLKGQNIEFHIISTKAYELENTKIYSILQ